MIDNPKTFLLKKMVAYKENGLESLGHLNAKYIDDLAKVLRDYGNEIIDELDKRLDDKIKSIKK
jgi:hypothetical protein